MFCPWTVTASASFLRRRPSHVAARHLDHELLQLHAHRCRTPIHRSAARCSRARPPTRRVADGLLPDARLSPCRIASRADFGMLAHGALRSNFELTRQRRQHDLPANTRSAPPTGESRPRESRCVGLPRMSCSLTRRRVPRPPQTCVRAERRVEREVARLELGQRDAAVRTAISFRRTARAARSARC